MFVGREDDKQYLFKAACDTKSPNDVLPQTIQVASFCPVRA
jgi:hypothetical protein